MTQVHPHDQVSEFHETYGMPIVSTPNIPDTDRAILRMALIREEYEELWSAIADDDLVEIADALGDLVYVIFGMALEYGIPLKDVIDEIHSSNMSKLGSDGKPIYREDGKILKGPHFVEPNIQRILDNVTNRSSTSDQGVYSEQAV